MCVRGRGSWLEVSIMSGVYSETWCSLLVVVENVQGLYDAVHGGVC